MCLKQAVKQWCFFITI